MGTSIAHHPVLNQEVEGSLYDVMLRLSPKKSFELVHHPSCSLFFFFFWLLFGRMLRRKKEKKAFSPQQKIYGLTGRTKGRYFSVLPCVLLGIPKNVAPQGVSVRTKTARFITPSSSPQALFIWGPPREGVV